VERRLAAILAADVVGYSRLMRADEEGTLDRLKAVLAQFIIPKIAEHNGRVVKLLGDGMLAEFPSVVDAVRAAVEAQQALAARNAELPAEKQINFRIGINLGDVVIEDGDIYGDGVNIAARLEGLAEAGGICISGAVYEQVRDRLEHDFADMGERRVKNIDRPLRTWRWTGESRSEVALSAEDATPPADKPCIAVLPFANLSGDPEQEYFADGIAEDIIIGLSRNPDLYVVSRNSTFGYKGKTVKARVLRDELGAQFVLEGSVRKVGQRIRITAELVDGTTDNHLWGERFDRDIDDVFAVQDEVVGSILHALGAADGILEKTARHRSAKLRTGNLTAYDCYLRGRSHFYRHGDAGFEAAEALFEKAISLNPGFARAYSALAWLHFVRFKLFRTKAFEEIRPTAQDLARHAIRLDPNDFRAHWVLGGLLLHEGKHTHCLAEFDKALRANPNDANLLAWSAEALVYCGRAEDAVARCERALKLNPNCPDWYYWIMGSALFHLGRYEEALAILERMSAPEHARRLMAATYAQLGRLEEARIEAGEFMKLVPDFSIAQWARTEYYSDPDELRRYAEGMIKAGFPE